MRIPIAAPRPARLPAPRQLLLLAACVLAITATRTARATDLFPLVPCWTGTDASANAQFPPDCPRGFTSRDGVLLVENGLPPGAALIGRLSIVGIAITSESPGGPLGGEVTLADATARLEMRGTGPMSGYSRTVSIPVTMRIHAGPQFPGPVRSFAIDLDQLQGQIAVGDPDFDLLRISAGTGFGMPSPGHAVLTRDVSGDFLVDSFFDITYRIDFVGHPGGPFTGMSGSTVSAHHQRAGEFTNPACTVPDNGSGTANFTPFCGGWQTKTEALLYDGALGTALIGTMTRTPPGGLTIVPGSPYGGAQTIDTELLRMEITGEGALGGFHRVVVMPLQSQHDLGPDMTSTAFEGRISQPTSLFQTIFGDPDFDLLRISSGPSFGMPTAGHTSLLQGAGANWIVDSFFDITYRIDFVGAPGSTLAGYSGSTTSDTRGQAGRERRGYCIVPDNGSGTAAFPPFCANGYRGPRHVRGLFDGMPSGSPLLADVDIIPTALITSGPGGPLGGELQEWDAKLRIDLTGVGAYAGYSRGISIPGTVRTATAPTFGGSNPQHFETDLLQVQGQLSPGDPDFDLLRISGGTAFGMPSPGHTTLTSAGGGNWNIDSFFDITYRIDFVGAIGGPFAGRSGSTNDRERFVNGDLPTLGAPPAGTPVAVELSAAAPNPTVTGAHVVLTLPKRAAVRVAVHDIAGRLVRLLEDGTREAGIQPIRWDGAGANGARVRPGLYVMRVDVDGARYARRVIVSR